MPSKDEIVETRAITQEEAEACANERVQFIGAVQPHGFVLVVDPKDNRIVQYSENALALINGVAPEPLSDDTPVLNTPITDWVELEGESIFCDLVANATQLFSFGEGGLISKRDWECLGVVVDKYVTLEFFPTTSKLDSYDLLINIDRMVTRIRGSCSTEELFNVLVQEFQKHADYDRVMLYRFFPDWSGEVVAESVSERASVKFLGLRFPSEDIPKQARELYKNSSLRIMADVDAEPSPLIPQFLPSGKPLDQSISVLRSMSKMHVAYLKNMGVKASMSIALMSGDKLWGLVACHHYSAKVPPNHLVSEMKASCELFADIVISHLDPAIDLETIQRTVANKHFIEKRFRTLKEVGYDVESLQAAMESVQAQLGKPYVGLCHGDRCFVAGGSWQGSEEFANRLQDKISREGGYTYESTTLLDPSLPSDFPVAPDMAGICALRSRNLPDLIVFFGASEVEKEISWGGKPGAVNIVIKNGERRLEPRSSFALWRQKVFGQSDPWTEEDRDLLRALMVSIEEYVLHCQSEETKLTLHRSSYNDNLTGLPNRRYLEEYFHKLSVLGEYCPMITVLFLDLDDFKRINDFMGHQAGDNLLKEVANRLKKCVRPDDLVARLGGDEFVVVVQHSGRERSINQQAALSIAEKIIHTVGQPVFESDQPMITTPSVGAVLCYPSQIPYGQILQQADIAMYRAKNAGKDQVHFFSSADQHEVNQEVRMELALRKTLEQGQIEVYFQPKVSKDLRVVGAEALARWNHPEIGFVPPDVFIPLAEKNNLISELGAQVFDASCRQLVQWRKKNNLKDFRNLSINISPVQLLSANFESMIRTTVERHNLSMGDIRLEITETLFMENFDLANKVLQSLRGSGMTVSLDDFGTGYSSLSYLWKLPIDEVKIDRSFIENMSESNDSLTMVEGIISLCTKMNLEVVAEGVEEKVQVAVLRGLGCDTYQGYLFGRPEEADDFRFKVPS